MITEWLFKQLDKYPNRIICNDGTIYNSKNGKKMALKPSKGYYLRARLYKDGKEIYAWVHRMVAGAFLGNTHGKHVHHKNRNRKDNRAVNLEIKEPEEHRDYHRDNKPLTECPF